MKMQLEHKIKDAYRAKDNKSDYARKNELWEKISMALGHTKGVAPFWRVAGVILALIAFGGVFGATKVFNHLSEKTIQINTQNLKLEQKIDSLLNAYPEVLIEYKTIEKEKIVFREKPAPEPQAENTFTKSEIGILENEISQLKNQQKSMFDALVLARDSLDFAIKERADFETQLLDEPTNNTSKFKLKTERATDFIQPEIKEESPRMKLQLIKIQDNIKYDTNSTLRKK